MIKQDKVDDDNTDNDYYAGDDDDNDNLDWKEKTKREGRKYKETGSKSDQESAKTRTSLQSSCKAQ